MTLTNKELNNQAQAYADRLLFNLDNDKKANTGFFGIGQKENDWDGIVAGLINYVWDEKIALEILAEDFAEEANDREAELAARQIATDCEEIGEAFGIITDCIDDWNTELENNNWTENVRGWVDENYDGIEALDVRFRTAEKVAYIAADWMKRCDFGKKARAMEAIGRQINQLWEVLKAADTIEEAPAAAPAQKVAVGAAVNLDDCF